MSLADVVLDQPRRGLEPPERDVVLVGQRGHALREEVAARDEEGSDRLGLRVDRARVPVRLADAGEAAGGVHRGEGRGRDLDVLRSRHEPCGIEDRAMDRDVVAVVEDPDLAALEELVADVDRRRRRQLVDRDRASEVGDAQLREPGPVAVDDERAAAEVERHGRRRGGKDALGLRGEIDPVLGLPRADRPAYRDAVPQQVVHEPVRLEVEEPGEVLLVVVHRDHERSGRDQLGSRRGRGSGSAWAAEASAIDRRRHTTSRPRLRALSLRKFASRIPMKCRKQRNIGSGCDGNKAVKGMDDFRNPRPG